MVATPRTSLSAIRFSPYKGSIKSLSRSTLPAAVFGKRPYGIESQTSCGYIDAGPMLISLRLGLPGGWKSFVQFQIKL